MMYKFGLKILKKLPLHLLFWAVVWCFFFAFFSVGSKNENFIFWFSTFLSAIAIASSYVFVYHLIPDFLIAKKQKQFVLYSFYAGVFIVCAVLMTMVFGFVFFYNLEFKQMPALTKNSGVILVCVLLIIALSSAFKILKHNYKSLDEKKTLENKFLQTQLQLKEQELKFLKMQIHPHFLFNTLNTLYGFALKKSEKAPEMILKLSNLLDYILYQVDKPLVFLQDVTGFMVGSKSEHGGIIKDGAKMVNAVSNSVVPKFTIIIGNSYGAGNYAMCGKAYDPRLIVAWPSANLAVMSGNSAAKVLLQIETASLKKQGKEISEKEEKELYEKIKARYDEQISPYYAASRIWTDAVIDPLDTRTWISLGIEAANHAPIEKPFNMGVIQV